MNAIDAVRRYLLKRIPGSEVVSGRDESHNGRDTVGFEVHHDRTTFRLEIGIALLGKGADDIGATLDRVKIVPKLIANPSRIVVVLAEGIEVVDDPIPEVGSTARGDAKHIPQAKEAVTGPSREGCSA